MAIDTSFKSALEARLYLMRNPKVVALLKNRETWFSDERNPLVEIARATSRDPEVNKKHLDVAKVLIEEFGANVNAEVLENADSASHGYPDPDCAPRRPHGSFYHTGHQMVQFWTNENLEVIDLPLKSIKCLANEQQLHKLPKGILETSLNLPASGILGIAAYNNKLPFIRLLLENGARSEDPVTAGRNTFGQQNAQYGAQGNSPMTAITIAKHRGHTEAVELLSGGTGQKDNISSLTDRIRAKPRLEKLLRDSAVKEDELDQEVARFLQEKKKGEAFLKTEESELQKLEDQIQEKIKKIKQIKCNMIEKEDKHELNVAQIKDDESYLNEKRRRDTLSEIEKVNNLIKALRGTDEQDGEKETKIGNPD